MLDQLEYIPYVLRIVIYICHGLLLVVISAIREVLFVTKNLPRIYTTVDEIHRMNFISRYSTIYRVLIIGLIYMVNLINALIFDSLTVFPAGWIIAGIISFIMEMSTDFFLRNVARRFGRSMSSIDHYHILYSSWHVLIIAVLMVSGMLFVWIIIVIKTR